MAVTIGSDTFYSSVWYVRTVSIDIKKLHVNNKDTRQRKGSHMYKSLLAAIIIMALFMDTSTRVGAQQMMQKDELAQTPSIGATRSPANPTIQPPANNAVTQMPITNTTQSPASTIQTPTGSTIQAPMVTSTQQQPINEDGTQDSVGRTTQTPNDADVDDIGRQDDTARADGFDWCWLLPLLLIIPLVMVLSRDKRRDDRV